MSERFDRQIKYESDLDLNFAHQIASFPGGERIFDCIQCGTCSGTCPLSVYMEYTPRRIIAMTRAGFKDEVVRSNTIWLCSSCYSCTVECPKEIKLTDIMYAIKRQAIRENIWPKEFKMSPMMTGEFFKLVEKNGRNSEGWLMMNLYMKSMAVGDALKIAGIGMKMFAKKRMSLKTEKIADPAELRKILDAAGSEMELIKEGAKEVVHG
ncbi:MAG: 4Fe-4S dicluster domain-containing protein [bacterium]|nr:4Fe-4S dicluster domain-containing protein [bacterium]